MAFKRAKITTSVVERLEPGMTVADTDLPGFGVRRQGDRCVYFARKFANGRRHYVTIGEHGKEGWTASSARREALLVIAAIRQGRDPASERVRRSSMPTLAGYAGSFIEARAGVLKPGTIATYRSLLTCHVAPRDARGGLMPGCLGRLQLDKVTHQDIAALHRRLRDKPRTANHVLALLSSIYSQAQADGLVHETFNPTRRVDRYPERPRQRFLTADEFARVGEALAEAEANGSESLFAIAAIRLLILTGCRRDEILGCRWEWIDFERDLLNLPDSKTGAKSVYLSPAALDVLRHLPRVSGNPFIIVGARERQRWINLRKVWVRIRNRAGLEPLARPDGTVQHVRLHDLRHSYASLLASGGASLPMIGRLLGHANPQTTARYAHLADDPVRRLADEAGQSAWQQLTRGRRNGG